MKFVSDTVINMSVTFELTSDDTPLIFEIVASIKIVWSDLQQMKSHSKDIIISYKI